MGIRGTTEEAADRPSSPRGEAHGAPWGITNSVGPAALQWPCSLHSQQHIAAPGSGRLAPLQATTWRWVDPPVERSFTPTLRTHPAERSHLGLAGRWLRWGRVGGRAEHDYIELAVELGEPHIFFLDLLDFFLDLLGFAPHPQGFVPQLLDFFLDLL